MLSLVLPLLKKDLGFFRNLEKSLDKYYNLGKNSQFFIITRDDEYHHISDVVRDQSYTIVRESSLLPKKLFFPKWKRQQFLKLLASELVSAPFYLTLDADVLCVQHTHEKDLIINGKAKTNVEPLEAHPDWWKASARLLQCDIPKLTCGVTPSILRTAAVTQLLNYLEQMYAKPAHNVLLGTRLLKCTEYTLYHTYLHKEKIFDKYHLATHNGVYGKSSIWTPSDKKNWEPSQCFNQEDEPGHFIVTQSSVCNPNEIWHKIKPYLST